MITHCRNLKGHVGVNFTPHLVYTDESRERAGELMTSTYGAKKLINVTALSVYKLQ